MVLQSACGRGRLGDGASPRDLLSAVALPLKGYARRIGADRVASPEEPRRQLQPPPHQSAASPNNHADKGRHESYSHRGAATYIAIYPKPSSRPWIVIPRARSLLWTWGCQAGGPTAPTRASPPNLKSTKLWPTTANLPVRAPAGCKRAGTTPGRVTLHYHCR